jgi:exoribonuclease R
MSENTLYLPDCEDRTREYTFTIDGSDTRDYDDAIGYRNVNGSDVVSVYISNVPHYMDFYDLWSEYTSRVATIYLPDKKRPLIPYSLGEGVLSLIEKETRCVFYMDAVVKDGLVDSVSFGVCTIQVAKNHVYDSNELHEDIQYQTIFGIIQTMMPHHPYQKCVNDSSEVIAYLMIFMNNRAGHVLNRSGTGIFRSLTVAHPIANIGPKVLQHIQNRKNGSASYKDFETHVAHGLLELDHYTHITSPIRRLVDVINMIQILQLEGCYRFSDNANNFCNEWMSKMEHINTSTKSTRKVQNECSLLHFVSNNDIENSEYSGYVIEKTGTSPQKYDVYIEETKTICTMKSNLIFEDYAHIKIKFFMFQYEDSLKQKVKIRPTAIFDNESDVFIPIV